MYYPLFSIALGALLLVLGVCDVCKRNITWGYSSRMKPKEREIWQRWVGVLELILAVCEFSYVFLTKMQRATSFLFGGRGWFDRVPEMPDTWKIASLISL